MVTAKKPSPGPETKRIEAMKDTPITPRRLMVIGTYMAALMTAGGWVVSEWVTPKVLAKAGEQLDEVREQMDGELAATVQKVFDRVDEKIELHRQSGSHPETAEAMERVGLVLRSSRAPRNRPACPRCRAECRRAFPTPVASTI